MPCMYSAATQVTSLVDGGFYEQAINLCISCQHTKGQQLRDIDIPRIHEKYALVLFQKGELARMYACIYRAAGL